MNCMVLGADIELENGIMNNTNNRWRQDAYVNGANRGLTFLNRIAIRSLR